MRSIVLSVIAIIGLMVVSCDSVLPINSGIAACQFEEVRFVLDIGGHWIGAWNTTTEHVRVKVRQERGSGWFDVFRPEEVEIRGTNECQPHHHVQDCIDYGEGDRFSFWVKQRDDRGRWEEWKTVWVILTKTVDGGQSVQVDSMSSGCSLSDIPVEELDLMLRDVNQ